MNTLDILKQVESPFRTLAIAGERSIISTLIATWADANLTVRVTRGSKMRSVPGIFDEFAAAFQFPLYFGENKDAFDECLGDLEGLPRGEGVVLVITEPALVLADAPSELPWFVDALTVAANEWAQPVDLGEWWDRPATPFHVVLASAPSSFEVAHERWRAAGGTVCHLA